MAKAPSDATLLRAERAAHKATTRNLDAERRMRLDFQLRAETAEKELVDWKKRFDQLLVLTGKVKP